MSDPFPEHGTEQRRNPSRRETVMNLVEMLLRDEADEEGQGNGRPDFEDDKGIPSADEAHQNAGAEAFHKFERCVNNLDTELRNFSNATRQLGSSAAILSSAFHLRTRLAQVKFLYRENAANLFPRKISHAGLPNNSTSNPEKRRRKIPYMSVRHRAMPHVARPVVTVSDNLDLEDFPEQFEKLAVEVTTFVNRLNEFPEFTDEAVNASISSFEGDLKYWASCLKEYEGQFRYPAIQRYVQDLTAEITEHIENITDTISIFVEVGVPTIRFAQQHEAENLQNLSTVATFFSGVTATTLSLSVDNLDGPVSHVINLFWFISLVFSIAAAVNSLLGLTWKQAMYRSPGHRVPWWVLIWIKRSPLFFLVISAACFSAALCLFTYDSGQHRITSVMTTAMTSVTSFGLIAVSTWFALERWAWSRHRGKKWLGDVLDENKTKFIRKSGIEKMSQGFGWIKGRFRTAGDKLFGACLCFRPRNDVDKVDQTLPSLPVTNPSQREETFSRMSSPMPSPPMPPSSILFSPMPTHILPSTIPFSPMPSSPMPSSPVLPPSRPPAPLSPIFLNFSPRNRQAELRSASPFTISSVHSTSTTNGGPVSPVTPDASKQGRQLWQNAIRTVKTKSQVTSKLAVIDARNRLGSRRQRTGSSVVPVSDGQRPPEEVKVVPSRVAALKPQLRSLEATQDLAAHQALVRHLQFSPDGKFLATSSWDRLSVIFRVGDPCVSHRVLAHAQGFVGQVAWSPDGKCLLTKLVRAIKVWTLDGVCSRTIDRQQSDSVEAITWLPGGEAFLSVEGSNVVKLDLQGKVLATYNFGNMKVYDVACSPDCVRLLGVGPMLLSPSGLRPSKSKVERRLVVYNMQTRQIENVTPVLDDVRHIKLARKKRNGVAALVSYENKAPPQLWKLEIVRDLKNEKQLIPRLTLRHTYMQQTPIDSAGPSYFGGKNDELVLCADKIGDIHIWDRESGALLHHIRGQTHYGDLTCMAWNTAAEESFMFATGSHDGAVRIWSKPSEFDCSSPESMIDNIQCSSPDAFENLELTTSLVEEQLESALFGR
ncbi:hypothetical protein D9758_002841 [Tetrapyrgos nigripes]|uniref:WD40 repeat-like protein n=1 Tax=Tetrapyrgos nigripes TaxID=182062 RepID=A0A8H5GQ23_9AGAR|nr:hypothetical protein D9758_002841 [Tetrapyrgos nigripes]